MSTHNVYFCGEIRKMSILCGSKKKPPLSAPMNVPKRLYTNKQKVETDTLSRDTTVKIVFTYLLKKKVTVCSKRKEFAPLLE